MKRRLNREMCVVIVCLCLFLMLFGCADSTKKGSYLVSGSFSGSDGVVPGVSCLLANSDYGSYHASSSADGTFIFSDIWNGTYTLTVSKAGYVINPSTITVTVNDKDVTVSAFSMCSTLNVTYGYALEEKASAVISDGNGGYVVVGSTTSHGAGNSDGYVASFDATGKFLWDHTYGGTNDDIFSSIARTSDGGYIIAGSTESSTLQASTHGGSDIWLVKIHTDGSLDTSFNGTGELCIGGVYNDYGAAVIQDKNGYYVVAGTVTNWNNADQLSDMFLAVIDSSGVVQNSYTYGNTLWEEAFALCEVSGGYVIAGTRETILGNYDIDVLKVPYTLDLDPLNSWEKVIDHGSDDEAKSVAVLADGTIVVTGYITAANGSTDMWTGLFSPGGALTREIISGGSSDDWGSMVRALPGGGFLVAGTTVNTNQNRGDTDYSLAGYSADGTLQWSSAYDSGSQNDDSCVGVVLAPGGYVLGGYSYHPDTKDDFWLLKVSLTGQSGGN
jgi:hypothetical protein